MNIKNLIAIGLASAAFLQCLCGQQLWQQTSLTTNANWYAVACSANGGTMVTGDAGPSAPESSGGQYGIWYSDISGYIWAQSDAPTNGGWQGFAVSADGTKMYAVDGGYDTTGIADGTNYGIWASTNYGVHWSQVLAQTNDEIISWFSIACSGDGKKVAAVGDGALAQSGVYTSTNGGTTWQHQTNAPSSTAWRWICSSGDGSKLAAVFNYDPNLGIVVSTNSGATWRQANAPTNDAWQTVVCTPDGANMAAVGNDTGLFWVSTNSGTTWFKQTSLTPDNGNFAVATSANGNRLVVVGPDGIFGSTNAGLNWIQETNDADPYQWQGVATSADGANMVAANYSGGPGGNPVFTAHTFVRPQLNLASASTNAVVSWIIPSITLGLQTSGNLTNAVWVNVTNVPVLNLTNLENQVTVPKSSTNGFFRLRATPA